MIKTRFNNTLWPLILYNKSVHLKWYKKYRIQDTGILSTWRRGGEMVMTVTTSWMAIRWWWGVVNPRRVYEMSSRSEKFKMLTNIRRICVINNSSWNERHKNISMAIQTHGVDFKRTATKYWWHVNTSTTNKCLLWDFLAQPLQHSDVHSLLVRPISLIQGPLPKSNNLNPKGIGLR